MTAPHPSTPRPLRPPPFGLRVGAILCAASGVWALLDRVGRGQAWLASHPGGVGWSLLALDVVGALLLIAGGALVWLRRRVGVLALFVGWVLPQGAPLAAGGGMRVPAWPLVVGLLLVALHVRRLR